MELCYRWESYYVLIRKEIAKITAEIEGLLKRAKEVDNPEDLLYGRDEQVGQR